MTCSYGLKFHPSLTASVLVINTISCPASGLPRDVVTSPSSSILPISASHGKEETGVRHTQILTDRDGINALCNQQIDCARFKCCKEIVAQTYECTIYMVYTALMQMKCSCFFHTCRCGIQSTKRSSVFSTSPNTAGILRRRTW